MYTERHFKILDTLIVPLLNETQHITIGYCQINDDNNKNLIAFVGKTDDLKIKHIEDVWVTNVDSEKIEKLTTLDAVNCINEHFPGSTSIPLH